ncbi:MAG: hypothetical protein INR73_25110 [Williamsia sp.]|nr:hypothetical protein [Williamsia sp.]
MTKSGFSVLLGLIVAVGMLPSCKTKTYEWEQYSITAVPIVHVNTAKSALPTYATANTSFFNLKDANVANQQFEFVLNYEGFGVAKVNSIELYLSYNQGTASTIPAYPIVLSTPGNVYPSQAAFYPISTTIAGTDKLFETVTTFPKTCTYTATQLAAAAGVSMSSIKVNDFFLFKFILNLADGRRIVGFQDNVCDESRGEPGDCRVGVRFKNQ